MPFLPTTSAEIEDLGWDQPDFIIITGDAYVDHPSFGHAIISRVLEVYGYKVAILAQPDWKSIDDFKKLGKPRLAFLINSGNVDSMVNHYSVFKKRRKQDQYSPGGIAGKRPDRAVIIYSNRAREAYKDVPIIIGGLEASLRRFAHYDYWDNKIRRSILLDAKADLLIYGMGEKAVVEIADALNAGIAVKDIHWIRGTVYKRISETDDELMQSEPDAFILPSFADVQSSPAAYSGSFKKQYMNNDFIRGRQLVEPYENKVYIVQNPPMEMLTTEELDQVYELAYEGNDHPSYAALGGVPAIEEVRFSITANRGCFGNCAFCALTYHQGRTVQGRSKESLVAEAGRLTKRADFKGYIHDVGGPTANFRKPSCKRQLIEGTCADRDCLYPKPCPSLEVDHEDYLDILRTIRSLPNIKKVFVRSGIRYDYAMYDKDSSFIKEICEHHISGTLKIAPEHISSRVLSRMRKPSKSIFKKFSDRYHEINRDLGLKQYLIPYFISSHPGSTMEDAIELAVFLKQSGFIPDQVQDFYPTPGTLATCMYYTGLDPLTMEKVYIPNSSEEKKAQRAMLHFNKPENYDIVKSVLIKAGRQDLIGFDQNALIRPERRKGYGTTPKATRDTGKRPRRV